MSKSLIVALGVVGLVAVGLCAVMLGGLGFKEEVAFDLKKDGQGVCKPSDPDPISSGWLRKVTWTVKNVDCDPQYVSLRNFKENLGGGSYGPAQAVTDPNPVNGGPIATGATMSLPKAKIDRFHFWKTVYKYEIWNGVTAGGVTLGRDPDIDIWP